MWFTLIKISWKASPVRGAELETWSGPQWQGHTQMGEAQTCTPCNSSATGVLQQDQGSETAQKPPTHPLCHLMCSGLLGVYLKHVHAAEPSGGRRRGFPTGVRQPPPGTSSFCHQHGHFAINRRSHLLKKKSKRLLSE